MYFVSKQFAHPLIIYYHIYLLIKHIFQNVDKNVIYQAFVS